MSLGSAPRGSYLCELMSQPFAELTMHMLYTDVRSWMKYTANIIHHIRIIYIDLVSVCCYQ